MCVFFMQEKIKASSGVMQPEIEWRVMIWHQRKELSNDKQGQKRSNETQEGENESLMRL